MKGNTAMSTVALSAIAIFLGVTLLMPLSAFAGDKEEQKSVYIAHELAYLIRTAALLPEESSYLLPDMIPNATVKAVQGRLVVKKNYDRSPKIIMPEGFELSGREIPLNFVYVTKDSKKISIGGSRSDTCLKTETGGMRDESINIISVPGKEIEKELLDDAVKKVSDLLRSVGNMKIEGDTKIHFKVGVNDAIRIHPGANRKHTSIVCFLKEELDWPLYYNDFEEEGVTIMINYETNVPDMNNKIKKALEAYYE